MADTKISALPASTTPLAGTEVLPIVQSSTTKQVSVANLTAGRAISATQITLTAGNVIPADGYGIDFSASSGSGTSELLNDYEEGTWTPNQGSGLTVVGTFSSSGVYTKVGRMVTVNFVLQATTSIALTGGASVLLSNLPFRTELSAPGYYGPGTNAAANISTTYQATSFTVYSTTAIGATSGIYGTITYAAIA